MVVSPKDLPTWPEVFQPVNLFGDFKLPWDLTVQDHREFHVRLILIGTSGRAVPQIDPLNILLAFARKNDPVITGLRSKIQIYFHHILLPRARSERTRTQTRKIVCLHILAYRLAYVL